MVNELWYSVRMIKPKAYVLYGRSGSGKGTQAKLLIEFLKKEIGDVGKVHYLETGKMLRAFAAAGDGYSNLLVRDVLENGGLLPEFIPIWVWTTFIFERFTGEEHLVFDGVCRRLLEAPILDSALKFIKIDHPVVINLDVSNYWAKEKLLSRGRNDDNEDDISNRLQWFDENVAPTIKYFENNPDYNFLAINGEQSIVEVHSEILKKLGFNDR